MSNIERGRDEGFRRRSKSNFDYDYNDEPDLNRHLFPLTLDTFASTLALWV